MQSCLDTDLSTPRPTLVTGASGAHLGHGWTHRVGALNKHLKPLADSLAGVPKAALRTIFDRSAAQRIWDSAHAQSGAKTTPQPCTIPAPQAASERTALPDHEILAAMIAYLARQAAQTLQQRNRRAHAVKVQFAGASGSQRTHRALLACPTGDAEEIRAAAQRLLTHHQTSADPLVSVNLTVETLAPDLPQQPIT
jgi:nucleotidyltransferase/DNA polymerase involved in DNA repair